MAGFLGDGWEDPRSAAIMALSGGLLRGDFGGGLLGANNAYAQSKEGALKQRYMGMQMDNMQSEIDTRKAQLAKQQQLLSMFGGGGSPAAAAPAMPGQLGSGSFGIVPPPAGQPSIPQAAPMQSGGGSRVGSMTPDQLVQAKMLGLDLTDVYKLTQPNWTNVNGNMVNTNDPNFKGGFQPGMQVTPDGKGIVTMPGANGLPQMAPMAGSLDTFGRFEDVKNRSAAGMKPIKVYNPDTQREEFTSEAAVVGGGQPQPQAGVQGAFKGRPDDVMGLIGAIKDPQERANAMAAFQEQAKRTPGFSQGGNFAAGQSVRERNSAEAGKELNNSFIKSRYEPALAAGDAAGDVLTNVSVARDSMRAMGGTGWGSETRAAAANALAGLGMAPENAKMYAANAQTFQNAAMSNLKTQLDAAKGPQTEGDADRGAKLWAQLKNTPRANEFILDMIEAKASRDQMKARFFQQAMPIAQGKGDLPEIEREWTKRAPSVFSMPSMKRWAQ